MDTCGECGDDSANDIRRWTAPGSSRPRQTNNDDDDKDDDEDDDKDEDDDDDNDNDNDYNIINNDINNTRPRLTRRRLSRATHRSRRA